MTNFDAIIQFGVSAVNKSGEKFKDTIDIRFAHQDIERFLFRFSPTAFIVDDFKFIFRYSNDEVHDLVLLKDDVTYVVTNLNQVFNEVYKAFTRNVVINKMVQVIDFDFEAAGDILLDSDNVEDEFGEK